jgi:predicted phosphodiesterase
MGRTREYSEEQIDYVLEQFFRLNGNWNEIVEKYNKHFKASKDVSALTNVYYRYKDEDINNNRLVADNLKQVHRTKKTNSILRRQNKVLTEALLSSDDVKTIIKEALATVKLAPPKKVAKVKPNTDKHNMTKVLVLSDLHYGKKIELKANYFDYEVARERMREVTLAFMTNYGGDKNYFNVDKLVIALLGDIIESASMHMEESYKGCEFGNSEQVKAAAISIFEDCISPIASLGVPVYIPCVAGNHDRVFPKKSMSGQGTDYLSFIVYSMLEMFCKIAGYTNVTFEIEKESYIVHDIYGYKILLHHGDHANRGTDKQRLRDFRMRVEEQVKYKIDGSISGHYHEPVVYGRGVDIVNGCLCGQDGFAQTMGYATEASQMLVDYIEGFGFTTNTIINLEGVK